MLGVDVGSMILLSAVISIPMLIVAVFYCKWIGKKIYQIPREDGTFDRKKFKEEYIKSMDQLDELIGQKQLPGLWASMAPIVVPLILILANTVLGFVGLSEGPLYQFMELVGSPIVALGIGTLLAIYGLMAKAPTKEVLKVMDTAIKDTGIIMLITGAGGSLGNVIKVSGIGDALGELVLNFPIPPCSFHSSSPPSCVSPWAPLPWPSRRPLLCPRPSPCSWASARCCWPRPAASAPSPSPTSTTAASGYGTACSVSVS